MFYFIIAFFTFLLSFFLHYIWRYLAIKLNILDYPSKKRKIHKKAMPLSGGIALILTFILLLLFLYFLNVFKWTDFSQEEFWALIIASLVILIGGIVDDKFDLRAKYQIISPLLAIIIILLAGIKINYINNPLGNGLVYLDQYKIFFIDLSYLLSFLWLLGLMYTTKLLDGLDGLVGGISFIASAIILFIILAMNYFQADLAYLTIILLSSLLVFLFFNFPPATLFLGEAGSLWLGFIIGVLSILSGSKIATALLVFALPIVDTAWVIFYRWYQGKSIFEADKNHLHHRLLALNWSNKQILFFIYTVSALFGLSTLILNTFLKTIILVILFILAFLFEVYVSLKLKQN